MTALAGSGTNDPRKLYITFTALLYGVVIDATLHRLSSVSVYEGSWWLNSNDALLFVAIVIVVQDFYFYHRDLPNVSQAHESKTFLLDIIVLGAWYALSLSAKPEATDTNVDHAFFLYHLTFFFVAVAVWEAVLTDRLRHPRTEDEKAKVKNIWLTHLPIALAAIIISVILRLTDLFKNIKLNRPDRPIWDKPEFYCLAFLILLFLVWRIYYLTHLPSGKTRVEWKPVQIGSAPSYTLTEKEAQAEVIQLEGALGSDIELKINVTEKDNNRIWLIHNKTNGSGKVTLKPAHKGEAFGSGVRISQGKRAFFYYSIVNLEGDGDIFQATPDV